ncbi:MAG: dihydropteroate synthase [Blastocatellia bacterium]|jgi:dihydropteroate synthase|nr:dihydropteroate synthase [Blastocatellia bacterium]
MENLPLSLIISGMPREWHIANGRKLLLGERTLIMGVLNVTPDSFSDGGQFYSLDKALAHAERMIAEGADIIDVGGESTRPGGSAAVTAEEELQRVLPTIERLAKSSTVPISIDTTKSEVARAALEAGAAIVNDISGLRFDPEMAEVAARAGAGLVLMHSRGTLATLHQLPPVGDIFAEVISSLRVSIAAAEQRGVQRKSIVIDPGIGFGKSQEQNIELVANLDKLTEAFPNFPVLVGTSRKSFLGRILADDNGVPRPATDRLHSTMATVTAAVLGGAYIVRGHDVKATVETAQVADSLRRHLAAG